MKQVVLGANHSAAITSDGRLYTWGEGACGGLGHGTENSEPLPRLVEALSHEVVSKVVCGSGCVCSLFPSAHGMLQPPP